MKTARILTFITGTLLFAMVSCKPQEDDPVSHFTDGIVVTTNTPSNIAGTTAICGSTVTANDMGLMIELGVCWSKNEQPTVEDYVEKTYKCSQPFNCVLTNLDPNTQYHVRGYAKYGTEYCYGDEMSFTTLNDSTSIWSTALTTIPAEGITYNSFTTGGLITLPSDLNMNFRKIIGGVCCSKSPNPTLENCEFYVLDCIDYLEYAEITEKKFYFQVYGLEPNTQYYYRAFIKYEDQSYYYADALSITTPNIPFQLDLTTDYINYYSWDNILYASGYMYCSKPEMIDELGFCYSMDHSYPLFESDLITTVGTPTGEFYNFESTITDLSANAKYYIRTYARYMTDSIRYGNTIEFYTY